MSLQGIFSDPQTLSDTRPSTLCNRLSSISLTVSPSVSTPISSGDVQLRCGGTGEISLPLFGASAPSSTPANREAGAEPSARMDVPQILPVRYENSTQSASLVHDSIGASLTTRRPIPSSDGVAGDDRTTSGNLGRRGLAVFLQRLECHGISHCDPSEYHKDV